MIFTYENGEKQFFTRKQYRRYNGVLGNLRAQTRRAFRALGGPEDKLARARACETKALELWTRENNAAFARGKRFVRRKRKA